MLKTPAIKDNTLLAEFRFADSTAWLQQLELIEMSLGMSLHAPGLSPDYVYFPATAIVSLVCLTKGGGTAEVAVVGNDGLVGVSVAMGGGSFTCEAVVQSAGMGFRVPGRVMKTEFGRGGLVMHLTLRYVQALIVQMTQTAVCNRHHSVERQVCRWLLHMLDRLPGNDVAMTHEMIAKALGVRREGVTESAQKLQRAGVISYSRGHITVLDRRGLERRACECYAVVAEECMRLRPEVMAA